MAFKKKSAKGKLSNIPPMMAEVPTKGAKLPVMTGKSMMTATGIPSMPPKKMPMKSKGKKKC